MDISQNGEDDVAMESQSREDEIEAFEIRRDYRNIRETIAGFIIFLVIFLLIVVIFVFFNIYL